MLISREDFELNQELENAKWEDFDQSKEVKVIPEMKWAEHLMLIHLDPQMIKEIKFVGEKKGKIGYHTLIKMWIAERLIDEMAHLRKSGFVPE